MAELHHEWPCSSDPYYKLLDILKLDNIFKLKTATFTHKILNNKECIPDSGYIL